MNGAQSEQAASPLARLQAWLTALPLVTKAVLLTCIAATAFSASVGDGLSNGSCLSTYLVVWRLQLYRLLVSPFIHAGILHLGLNMLAFVPIARGLEARLGSIFLVFLITTIHILGSAFFLVSTGILERLGFLSMGSCALGISGIIFGLIVCDTHLSGVQMRSIFGLFTVPAQFYPLALLVFCQLILPRASLFGHLGGLLAGQLLIMGALNCVVPGSSRLQAMESEVPFRYVILWNSFVQSSSTGPIFPTELTLPTTVSVGNGRQILQDFWRRVRIFGRSSLTGNPSGSTNTSQQQQSHHASPGGMERDPKVAAAAAAEARAAMSKSETI